jgi:hypothetical protein
LDVEYRPLTDADALLLADRLRPMDRLEQRCMEPDRTPRESLLNLAQRSRRARAAYVGGELVCAYGVLPRSQLSSVGNPWFLATDTVDTSRAVRRQMARRSMDQACWVAEGFNTLWNVIHADNRVAIRWLKHLGFSFPGQTITLGGETFRLFIAGKQEFL